MLFIVYVIILYFFYLLLYFIYLFILLHLKFTIESIIKKIIDLSRRLRLVYDLFTKDVLKVLVQKKKQ